MQKNRIVQKFNDNGPFVPHRSPDRAWREFLVWWGRRWPGREVPTGLHNLRELTGLPDYWLEKFLRERSGRGEK